MADETIRLEFDDNAHEHVVEGEQLFDSSYLNSTNLNPDYICPDWISVSLTKNAVPYYDKYRFWFRLVLTIQPNSSFDRAATVSYTTPPNVNIFFPTFEISQAGLLGEKPADDLRLLGNAVSLSSDAQERVVGFVSAGNLGTISLDYDSDWFSADIDGNNVIISVLDNGGAVRNGRIVLHSESGLSDTLFIYQDKADSSGGDGVILDGRREHRLVTWQHSADSAYLLLCFISGNRACIEVWDEVEKTKLGELFIDDFDASSADILDVNFYSVNDVVYITHENFRPKKLVRYGSGTIESPYLFELSDFDIKIDPILDLYADRNVFSVGAGSFNTGDVVSVYEKSLTAGQIANGARLLFTEDNLWRGHGGQMLMLNYPTEMTKTWGLLFNSTDAGLSVPPEPKPDEVIQNSVGGLDWASEWIFAFGKIGIETNGKWSGRLVVELWKPDMAVGLNGEPLNPEEIAFIDVSNAQSNKSISRDLSIIGSRIRIRCVRRERAIAVSTRFDYGNVAYSNIGNDTGCYITLSNAQEVPVYLRIESVFPAIGHNEGYAVCRAIHPFNGGWTSSSFAEGAWSGVRYGYPKSCGVFQERMVFASNKIKPCTLWLSKTSDWSNFVQGYESTSPIFATANTDNIDTIQWLQIAKSYVMFGSSSGEWYFGASDGGAVKPSNYSFQRLSNFGSTRGVRAVLFGESTIVAKNGGKEVVDVSYNTLSEQGSGTNLSLFASHLFEDSVIKDMTSTIAPNSILWVLNSNGVLMSFAYEGGNNVFAWARQEILDGVDAITSFRRGERDILAILVRDGDLLMLSELDPFRGDDYSPDSDDEFREHVFMDERADGTFSRYESRIVPTPIMTMEGSAYGRKTAFRAFDIYLKTHNGNFTGNVWADGTEFSVILGDNSKPYVCDNGWLKENIKRSFGENRIELPMNSGWGNLAICDIRTDYPAPLTITAIGADFAYGN